MGRDYTATELIASVQQRAQIALAARDFGSTQILRLFNEEIDGYLVPFVAQRRMEFWVESAQVTTNGSGVGAIPSVAMGGKVRALAYMLGGIPYLLDPIDLPMAVASGNTPQTQLPNRYYFMGNNFVLFPPPSAAALVNVYYYRRPSQLVLSSACAQITNISSGGGNYTLSFGVNLPGIDDTTPVDLISNSPNFALYATGITAVSSDLMDLTFSGAIPSGLALGDWVALAGTAPVITGCPADLVNLIIQYVALKVAEAKGGSDTMQNLAAGLLKAEKAAGWTIQQRNDGAMKKLSAFPDDATGGWPWCN